MGPAVRLKYRFVGSLMRMDRPILIGHKGADALEPGNTIDSFIAAVEQGVELIEFDVLRTPEGRLVVAHDLSEAANRPTLGLREALDAFLEPPLDEVEIDLDIKLVGREAEIAGALTGAGLVDRAMVSTMEVETLWKLRGHEPDLRLGLTYPKTRVDWTAKRWAAPAMGVGLAALQRRYVKILPRRAEELSLTHTWAYHRVITESLLEAARSAGVKVMAWTVDDPARITELAEMGVDGICTNDPRLYEQAFAAPAAQASGDAAAKDEAGANGSGDAASGPAGNGANGAGDAEGETVSPAGPARP